MTHPSNTDVLLRTALIGNALFSGLSAMLFGLGASTVAFALGVTNLIWMYGLAFGLLCFALLIWYTLRQPTLPRHWVGLIIIADAAWVLGSFWLLRNNALPFTTVGWWGMLTVANVVGLFAVLQTLGLIQARRK
jgi:hypothetical protein